MSVSLRFVPVDSAWMGSSTFLNHFADSMKEIVEGEIQDHLAEIKESHLAAKIQVIPAGDSIVIRSDAEELEKMPENEQGVKKFVAEAVDRAMHRIDDALDNAKQKEYRSGNRSMFTSMDEEVPMLKDWLV